jgi:acetolactate synthase-1/2/3 large subunit
MTASNTVADAICARIAALGVQCVFSIPGGLCSGFDHALYRSPLRVIVCQHEAIACYAAAGYHRATGLPGIVVVTGGPGVLNCAAPLAAARLDRDGVIVLGGDVSLVDQGRGVLQDGGANALDLASVVRPLSGVVHRAECARAAAVAFEEAITRATGRVAGPTLVLVPIDVQQAAAAATVFGGSATPTSTAAAPFLQLLADTLSGARQPTIVAGRGVIGSVGVRAVFLLAETLGAPIVVDPDALGRYALDHPLVVGAFGVGDDGTVSRWLAANPPSPLIAIGARLNDITTSAFSPLLLGGGLIQLDEAPERLGRAVEPIAAFSGDVAGTIAALVPMLARIDGDALDARIRSIARVRQSRPPLPALEAAPFHPVSAARAVLRALPRTATVTTDIGNHMLATLRALQLDVGRPFEISHGLGGMGSGLGLAIGLSLGGRGSVTCFCGDGTLAMSGNDLLTAAKYRIPVTFVAFCDGYLGMVRHGIRRVYGSTDEYALPSFDMVAWGQALGVSATLIDSESILRGRIAAPHDGPRLLVVPVDPEVQFTNPRESVINFPEPAR